MELTLYIENRLHRYEVECFTRMFFHGTHITVCEGAPENGGDWVHTRMEDVPEGVRLTAAVCLGGQRAQDSAFVAKAQCCEAECERVFAVLLHGLLTKHTGATPGWGVLTGIRPVKLIHAMAGNARRKAEDSANVAQSANHEAMGLSGQQSAAGNARRNAEAGNARWKAEDSANAAQSENREAMGLSGWQGAAGNARQKAEAGNARWKAEDSANAAQSANHEAMGLSGWQGMDAGADNAAASGFAAAMGTGMSEDEIAVVLREKYLVTPEKIALTLETARNEARVLARSRAQSYSLYLSVPFCPTRCSYCSFVSHSIEKTEKLVPEYVERLLDEAACAARCVREAGLALETVYIGGGTPTTLSAQQLERVMNAVKELFGVPATGEFTVEAGRPDTITAEKLRTLKECGATRISINPQTMDDGVLAAIGRRHTARQTEEAFALAREAGHGCINMDLIAGLPTDTFDGFCATVERVLALAPENITLHTLSVKRAAELTGQAEHAAEQTALVERMLAYAAQRFHAAGHHPYYLYRQKNTLGNMENVGWCRAGCEGLYNVFIMDETHSIVALGAGGVTKLRRPGGTEHIERVFNFKYPYEYLSRFPELLARKQKIVDFYKKYPVK